ncbi:MAG: DUF885 family protein, partial [Pseudomonadota bacterium]
MTLRLPLIALALGCMAPTMPICPAKAAQAEAPASADERLQALYEADWAWQMHEFAVTRNADGELTPGGRLSVVTPEAQTRRLAHREETLRQLDAIPLEALSDNERINASVFRTNLEIAIADARYREWEMPLNSDTAFWTGLNPRPGQLTTVEDYRRFLGRLGDIPRFFSENIANMRAGL